MAGSLVPVENGRGTVLLYCVLCGTVLQYRLGFDYVAWVLAAAREIEIQHHLYGLPQPAMGGGVEGRYGAGER
eukprot:1805130-Rhodomonas_salina.1